MSANDAIISIPSSHGTFDYETKEKFEPEVTTVELSPSPKGRPQLKRHRTGRRQLRREDSDESQNDPDFDAEKDKLKLLGRVYHKILNFNIITRFLVYLLPVALALAVPLIIFATVAKSANADNVPLFGLFVWLEIIWASLWLAKLCSKALPQIFKFLSGMVSAKTRTYSELIRALELQISFFVWVVVCWATVPVIGYFNMKHPGISNHAIQNMSDWPQTLRRVMLASIPAAGVWVIEKFLIQLIATNYHEKQFEQKIRESGHMIDLLTELYSTSIKNFPPYCDEFIDEDYRIHNSFVATESVGQARAVLGGLARVGNGVTSVFTGLASEVAGGRELDPSSDKGVVVFALQKKCSAEALAHRLWISLAENGMEALYEEDIIRVLGKDRQQDAETIFRHLDRDRNGDVSLDEMVTMLIDFEQSQKAMVRSMHDVKASVAALDRILMAAALVITAGIYAAFFSTDFLKNLAVATTSIMSFSFAFAGTVQEFAGSCIFIFIKHPYDCDDRVEINGVEMIVKHISLLYTVFERIDTNRLVQIPNIINNGNWVENVTRSGAMKERIDITIDSNTCAEDIEALHDELNAFVLEPENKRDYQPLVLVDVNAIGDFKSLELKIEYSHKSNWTNETLRLTRRTKFLTAVIAAMRRVPIYAPGCHSPAMGARELPSYSVTITDAEAKAAQAELDAKKEAERLQRRVKKESSLEHSAETIPTRRRDTVERGTGRRPSGSPLEPPL